MPIKQITPKSVVNKMVDNTVNNIDRYILKRLEDIGEECFSAMRALSGNDYTDRTGNLRASSGYIIIKNGKIVSIADFQEVIGTIGKGTEGIKEGKDYASEIASNFPTGYTLVLLAGMKYAYYVQEKGYNVITSARLVADTMVKELKSKING